MNLKKFLSVMLLGAMCVGFVACENNEPEEKNNQTTGQTNSNGNGSGSGSGGGTTNPTTPTYAITLSVNDEAMGTVTGAGTYKEGAEATLEATANEGYKFVKWSDDETENPRTVTVTEDLTLVANFEAENSEPATPSHNGHAYVDLGLPSGLLWATCNVGAENPEEYGDYFAWGEVEPKSYYSFYEDGEYKWGTYNSSDTQNYGMTKYNKTDGKTVLDPEDDAAVVNWGGDWRMPTWDEIRELYYNCTTEWTTDYNGTGVAGRIVTSDINGNSIFLPAAGYRSGSSLNVAGSDGYYLSSSLEGFNNPDLAYGVGCNSDSYYWNLIYRFSGNSVRAVCSAR